MFGEDNIVKQHKERVDYLLYVIIVVFGIILSRLWFLQIFKGDEFFQYSLQNILRKQVVRASRGIIFDRNKNIMVRNFMRFDLSITPQYLLKKDRKRVISRLSEIINITPQNITKTLKKYKGIASFRPIIIKKDLSRKEVALIETENFKLPGVSLSTFKSRDYRNGEIDAHVIGYISEISARELPKYRKRDKQNYSIGDMIGKTGIEHTLDNILRGQNGYEYVQVDAFGRKKKYGLKKLLGTVDNRKPISGNHVRLTIDEDLQKVAYNGLEGKVGSAIALNVENGEVLAMVSRPSFSPDKFSSSLTRNYWNSLINNPNNPLINKAIQEHYSPGSTFKAITAIAALEEGIIDENFKVKCTGSFRLGRRVYHCWKRHGHGEVVIKKALKESCDVFFYKVATMMDIDVLAHYAHLFGFGVKTGIDLKREIQGLIPTRAWKLKKTGKPWIKGETLSCAIGQSFVLSTPLQLARAYMAIANGGKLYKPHLIKDIFSSSGELLKSYKPELQDDFKISSKTLKIVRDALYAVVNERKGTAWWHRGKGIEMSGKTGTSQVINIAKDQIYAKCKEREFRFRHHALFTAYAPRINPKIAVAVIVEHGCHGGSAAAPVAEQIITTYLKKYYPNLITKKSVKL